jgi:AcrR family transcriptional regulator
MTPRQRDRRERLLEAGLALLATDDYENVQVKDIADRAGVSLGTLYNYFSSKERFFAEVLVRWADTLPTKVRRRPPSQDSPAERLKETVHRALHAFERQPQMARLVNVLTMSTDPSSADIMRRVNLATTDAYMQALAGVEPADARRMVEVVHAVFGSSLLGWSLGRRSMSDVIDSVDSAIELVVR